VGIEFRQGDVIEVLQEYEDESFVACVCDPPYGLNFMGRTWDHGVPGEAYWLEVLRVLKPGGVLLAFGGPRTFHRLMSAIEDAGFDLCDTLCWLQGQGLPKSTNISKRIDKEAGAERPVVGTWKPTGTARPAPGRGHSGKRAGQGPDPNRVPLGTLLPITAPATPDAHTWDGWGTGLKPSWEPIVLARKPRQDTYAQTAIEHGSGALWIEGTRVGSEERTYHGMSQASKGKGVFRDDNWDAKDIEVTVRGRWPSNLLLSHSAGCAPQTQPCPNCGGRGHIRGEMPPFKASWEEWYAKTKDYGGTREEYDKLKQGGIGIISCELCGGRGSAPVVVRMSTTGKWNRTDGMRPFNNEGRPTGYHPWGPKHEDIEQWDCEPACPSAMIGDSAHWFPRLELCGDDFLIERFLFQKKADRAEREAGLHDREPTRGHAAYGDMKGTPEHAPNTTGEVRNPHPTIKPLAVCRWLARLCRPPEAYLDEARLLVPFSGTGSEIIGALLAGWRNITGIEISEEYLSLAEARLGWWQWAMEHTKLDDPAAILRESKDQERLL